MPSCAQTVRSTLALGSAILSAQAQHLRKLGVRTVQLILGPQIIEQRSALNNSALRAATAKATIALPPTGAWRHPLYAMGDSHETLALVRAQGCAMTSSSWTCGMSRISSAAQGAAEDGISAPGIHRRPPAAHPTRHSGKCGTGQFVSFGLSAECTIVGPSAAPGPGVPEGSAVGWQPQANGSASSYCKHAQTAQCQTCCHGMIIRAIRA